MNENAALLMRYIRRLLSSRYPLREPVFERVSLDFCRAQHLVRFYYLFSVFISYTLMTQLTSLANQSLVWNFLWPVSWLSLFNGRWAIDWLPVALMAASILALLFPMYRVFRLALTILGLFATSVYNSKGGIDHEYHVWLWISFCFVFLPDVNLTAATSRSVKMAYLSIFASAQSLILLFYSLAGLWKVLEGLKPLLHGMEGNFAPRGLSLQLADRMLATGTSPLLGDFAVNNYWIIWPMFLLVMYIQFTAVFVALRPRLHVVWGTVLIMFHTGTWLLMQIPFADHMFCVGLLFVLSPFRPRSWNLREVLSDLPGFGILVRLFWPNVGGVEAKRMAA
jgi:hypothetical protein